ncbi:UNVERIFIED_CONTAM: protein LONGIFOLIA 1 [Sesamum latifolium]|uniref:Protein LONGIFOLIA 1 n=1 Tax=Sesamum latifolium TaxID=2727402 RepID=A0AAW2XAD8_9LAMI
MSAKTMPSLTDENRDLRKQIGCMHGIFQLFDRQHFLTGRRVSSHSHKKLLQGLQHEQDPQYATKDVIEKDLEVQKEKPRISTESSRASYSSSSCSSTFSSLDCNRIAQSERLALRQINIPESPCQITAVKEQKPSFTKGKQSLDLRDVVKDSMYREARCLSIKSLANDERRGTAMKHIDSPRPSQQAKSRRPNATSYEGSARVLGKVQESIKNSKDDRLTLHRLSYDGRESGEAFKSAMKQKELPRLSLDSKASSMKSSALESSLNFLGGDLHVENENPCQNFQMNQEPGSHNRTSSVVAKLMGLEAFSETISTNEGRTPTIKSCSKEAFSSQLTSTAEESKQNQVANSPRASQNNPILPSPKLDNANFVRKPTTGSRFPMEPAPWRQQDFSQGYPKMASQSRKAPTGAHLSLSVYGEIEKRITELEFKRSGKDLRALKQILEAMQKTRDRLDDQRGESAEFPSQRRCSLEDSCSDLSNLLMWKNRKSYHEVPTIKGHSAPKQLGSSVVIMQPAKVINKVKHPVSSPVHTRETSNLQRLHAQNPRYIRGNSAHRQKAKELPPKNNNMKDPSRQLPSTDKKTIWGTSEPERILGGHQRMKVENSSTRGRSSGMVSPRLQQNLLRIEEQSHPTTPSSDSGRLRKHCSRILIEKGPQNRKHKMKTKDQQLCDSQLNELSSETIHSSYQGDTASIKSESNNSLVSQTETEVTNLAHSMQINSRVKENSVSTTREHMPAVEISVTMLEQPSPISVLDDTFYSEDSPSPIKKISTAFRDEGPSPDEAEWQLENLHRLTDCTRSSHGRYNQKSENVKIPVHKLRLLNAEPDEIAEIDNALVYGSLNPDHRYINKILMTSGLLKDSSFISTTDQILSSRHLINPDMFYVLEQTEESMEGVNGEAIEKNNRMELDKKIQRKIIFDMVDEILVSKITSGRLFAAGKKRTNRQGLLKEVYLEIDRLCRIPESTLDDEVDEINRLLTADMKYQSEGWTDYSGETPALALDIERLIFKDLINEVVTGEVMGYNDLPKRHCRQLFSK